MEMSDELKKRETFDVAFIDSMILHRASTIEMASTANIRSDNSRIKRFARDIIDI